MLVPLTPDHVSCPPETRRTSSWRPSSVFSSTQSIHSQCDFIFCSFSLSAYISFFLDISLPLTFPPLLTIIPFDLLCILSCHICYVKAKLPWEHCQALFRAALPTSFLFPQRKGLICDVLRKIDSSVEMGSPPQPHFYGEKFLECIRLVITLKG